LECYAVNPLFRELHGIKADAADLVALFLHQDVMPRLLPHGVALPREIHDGKQRLNASNHFGFPCSRMRRVSKAHNRFRSPARKPSHVSESAMTLRFGLPNSPVSTVNFPSRIVTVASAGSLPVKTKW
jgi:hypothetical protein